MPSEGNVFYYGKVDGYYYGRESDLHLVRIDNRMFKVKADSRDEAIEIAIQANLN